MDLTPAYIILNDEAPVTPLELHRAVNERRYDKIMVIDRSDVQEGAFSLDWWTSAGSVYILFCKDRTELDSMIERIREAGFTGQIVDASGEAKQSEETKECQSGRAMTDDQLREMIRPYTEDVWWLDHVGDGGIGTEEVKEDLAANIKLEALAAVYGQERVDRLHHELYAALDADASLIPHDVIPDSALNSASARLAALLRVFPDRN